MTLKANKIEKERNLVLAQVEVGTCTHPSFDVCIWASDRFPENMPKHEP